MNVVHKAIQAKVNTFEPDIWYCGYIENGARYSYNGYKFIAGGTYGSWFIHYYGNSFTHVIVTNNQWSVSTITGTYIPF